MTNLMKVMVMVTVMLGTLLTAGVQSAAAQAPVDLTQYTPYPVNLDDQLSVVYEKTLGVPAKNRNSLATWQKTLKSDGTPIDNVDVILAGEVIYLYNPAGAQTPATVMVAPQTLSTTNTAGSATNASGATSVARGDKPQSPPEANVSVPATPSTTAPAAKVTPKPAPVLPSSDHAWSGDMQTLLMGLGLILSICVGVPLLIVFLGLAARAGWASHDAKHSAKKQSAGKEVKTASVIGSGVKTQKKAKLKPAKIAKPTKEKVAPRQTRQIPLSTDAFAGSARKPQSSKPAGRPFTLRLIPSKPAAAPSPADHSKSNDWIFQNQPKPAVHKQPAASLPVPATPVESAPLKGEEALPSARASTEPVSAVVERAKQAVPHHIEYVKGEAILILTRKVCAGYAAPGKDTAEFEFRAVRPGEERAPNERYKWRARGADSNPWRRFRSGAEVEREIFDYMNIRLELGIELVPDFADRFAGLNTDGSLDERKRWMLFEGTKQEAALPGEGIVHALLLKAQGNVSVLHLRATEPAA